MNKVKEIIQEIQNLQKTNELILVAIDGVGGAGKSTVASLLHGQIQDSSIIQMDDFYSPELQRPDVVRLKTEVLIPLHSHKTAHYQIFLWKTNTYSNWQTLPAQGVIIFEGIFSLEKDLHEFYDIKVWVDCPAEVGYERGVKRDKEIYHVDNTEKWQKIWMPLEEKYHNEKNPKQCADYIIDGTKVSL